MDYKVSVLVFIKNTSGQHLLLKRNKSPNLGCWTPIGGKLEMPTGESPFECAIRETFEETRHPITTQDLHLFAMIAEKAYEGKNHWLLFLFNCTKPIEALPPSITEGHFSFFHRHEIDKLPIPNTDRQALWAIYDQYRSGFVAMKADCDPQKNLKIVLEQQL